jgi:C-terminal processing protease CtpA/Prc
MSRIPFRTGIWLLGAAAIGVVGCRNKVVAHDPNDGAYHLPVIGHTDPYGQADDVTPVETDDQSDLEVLGRKYGPDVASLSRVLDERWANRERHRELDGVDTKQVMEDLARAAGQARSDRDFADALHEATCRLSDGHLRIQPDPDRSKRVTSGITVVVASGDIVIAEVDDDAFETGQGKPKAGDVVVEIDGQNVSEYLDRRCVTPGSTPSHREAIAASSLGRQTLLTSHEAEPTGLTVRRGKKRHKIKLDWKTATGGEPGPCVEGKMIGPAGLVTIHTFACGGVDDAAGLSQFRRQLGEALDAVSGAKRLTVDIRHNPGGSDDQAKAAAARLVPGNPVWMRFRHADDQTEGFREETLQSDDSAISKPMAVLIGPGCVSTCEIFASVLANRDDTILIGEPTAGSVGNPQPIELSRSGLSVSVPRTQYALPGTDVLIEGRGIAPSVEVRMTADDIRRRRDPALENAIKRQ